MNSKPIQPPYFVQENEYCMTRLDGTNDNQTKYTQNVINNLISTHINDSNDQCCHQGCKKDGRATRVYKPIALGDFLKVMKTYMLI